MEQNEVRPGGLPRTLGGSQEDNTSGGSGANSFRTSENKPPKQASRAILDPSGDPADRAREANRAARPRLDGLTVDTMQLIRDKPLGAAVTAFGVGLVLGLALGVLIARD